MQFPQDGGLSCVRYYLASRDDALEQFARSQMRSEGCHVGRLVCQCRAEDYWEVYRFLDGPLAIAVCGCNGSSLPIFIGRPPFEVGNTIEPEPDFHHSTVDRCDCGSECRHRIALCIGYPADVPKLGTLDVERAQELLIASECANCNATKVQWHLSLPEPPTIVGDEPWIRRIQGLGYGPKTRWG